MRIFCAYLSGFVIYWFLTVVWNVAIAPVFDDLHFGIYWVVSIAQKFLVLMLALFVVQWIDPVEPFRVVASVLIGLGILALAVGSFYMQSYFTLPEPLQLIMFAVRMPVLLFHFPIITYLSRHKGDRRSDLAGVFK